MNNKNLNEITNCHSGLDPESRNEMLSRQATPKAVFWEILNQVQDDQKMSIANNQVQHDSREECEQGRSMIEMLGVLAVMGLLTIIGIAGFKIAMNKAKANNLVADMNRLAHIVVMDKFLGYSEEAIQRALSEDSASEEYQVSYQMATSKVFRLDASKIIDKNMCEQVANLNWQMPIGTYLNGRQIDGGLTDENCTDENQLTWFFTYDLSQCPDCALSPFKCDIYGSDCGVCSDLDGFTANQSQCAGNSNGTECVKGRCTHCPEDKVWYGTASYCYDCGSTQSYWSVESEKYNCLGKMYWDTTGYMRGCEGTWGEIYAELTPGERESCIACENRCFNTVNNNCPRLARGFTRNDDGTCGDCKIDYWWRNDIHGCTPCTNVNNYWGTNEASKHNCPKTMYYEDGSMWGCKHTRSDWKAKPADEQSCKNCDERCYYTYDQSCRLTGEGKAYVRNTDGTCSCSTVKGAVSYNNYCYYCPVNQYLYLWYGNGPGCRSCENVNNYWGTLEEYKDHCPGTMYYEDGSVWGCKHTRSDWKAKPADKASCILCAERCYLESDQSCRLMGTTYTKDETTGNCILVQ